MKGSTHCLFSFILVSLCFGMKAFSQNGATIPGFNGISLEFVAEADYLLENDTIGIQISMAGEIVGITDKLRGHTYPLREFTAIEGLFPHKVKIDGENRGGIKITQVMRDSLGDRSCTIVKKISVQNDAVHLEVQVQGDHYAWTAPIRTELQWPINENTKLWMAWGKKNSEIVTLNLDGEKTGGKKSVDGWEDPLIPKKFEDLELSYGGIKKNRFVKAFSLPLATILQPDKESSFNIVFSPRDTLINMEAKTTDNGSLIFTRSNHRISPENKVSYTYDLFFKEDDWRPVLGWITKKYPTYFTPSNTRAHKLAGTASYSGYNGDMDVQKYRDMAYGFNWYAVRNWPYLGMFLPPVEEGETWRSWSGFGSGTATESRTVSFDSIRYNHKLMQQRGFHLLEYFNLNEFGYRIRFPYDSTLMNEKEPLWKKSNNLLHHRLKPAMLHTEDNRARFSWNRSVVMDPGHEVYHDYLMGQAERMVEHIPEFSGICIDRLDWYEGFNYRRDDGISMVNGKKVWAMPLSLHKIMEPLSDLMHKNNKVIFYNPHITRLDYAQYFDGVFDEFADKGNKINLSAFLALKKPMTGWIHEQAVIEDRPDHWMQKYLYMGVYPMAPYPEANHSLESSQWADALFLDYGLVFKALKGKQWVFGPHVAVVEDDAAKINVFKTYEGFLVPIVLGNDDQEVTVGIQLQTLFGNKKFKAYVARPGDRKWTRFRSIEKSGKGKYTVKLKRGAAIILLK